MKKIDVPMIPRESFSDFEMMGWDRRVPGNGFSRKWYQGGTYCNWRCWKSVAHASR